jgi:hypothetical protein
LDILITLEQLVLSASFIAAAPESVPESSAQADGTGIGALISLAAVLGWNATHYVA